MKPPSRNPADYTTTTHFKQRIRDRDNPPIMPAVIEACIKDGQFESEENDYGTFMQPNRVNNRLHEFFVVVNTEKMLAVSSYCRCHSDDKSDCKPHLIRDNYDRF